MAQKWPRFLRLRLLPVTVFLVTAVLTLVLWQILTGTEIQRRQLETQVTAEQVKLRLEAWFDTRKSVVAQFADEWSREAPPGEVGFTLRASRIVELYPGFQALNFIDSQQVIRIVVPPATNQAALGKDLAEHPYKGVIEALTMARESRTVHRSPLIFLLQGEPGFATYMPIFSPDDNLLGFVNGVFGVDELVDSCLSEPNLRERFHFRLVTSDGGMAYEHTSGGVFAVGAPVVELPVRIIDRPWDLQITLSTSGMAGLSTRADEALVAVGFALSLLLGLLLWAYQRRLDELDAGRAQYQLIVENQVEFLVKIDLDGLLLYSSPSFCQFLGRDENQILGTEFPEHVAPEFSETFSQAFDNLKIPPYHQELEIQLSAPHGQVWTSWSLVSYLDASGNLEGAIGVGRDVSQRRELESQLRQSQRLQAVGQLAGGIAHDFNNILQAIQGYIEFVREDLPADTPAHDDLAQANLAADRAAVLVRQLLAFSRRQILMPVNLNLNRVIEHMTSMMERMIGPSVEIRLQGNPELELIRADQGQVEQILMNLAVNSRDAMPTGGTITMETSNVHLDEDFCRKNVGKKPGPHVKLTFRDDGEGMSPEVLEKLFEPFFTTKDSGTGTGLGLATVYGIVKQHDGIITVKSSVGQGAEFSIYLPAAGGEEFSTTTLSPTEPQGGHETILLVEDEPLLRSLGQRTLASAGYQVMVAGDGEEALEIYMEKAAGIDALVLDVVMPRMNGTELAARIREQSPGIPIVFVSGYDSQVASGRRQFPEDSVRLPKPYTTKDLLEAVRQVIVSNGDSPGKET